MKNQTLVTTYTNPDLDGVACAIAYAEFLQKRNRKAIAAFFGVVHREARFALKTFAVPQPEHAEKILLKNPSITLVDASDTRGISEKINPVNVIEIIDHRKRNEADKFPNATVHIELVGAAATMIAEKFLHEHISISPTSAALLYSAIVSNTVNFQADVTTDRDKKMARWLLTFFSLPKNYVHEMFMAKSVFEESLIDTIRNDFATFVLNGITIGIGQLEMMNGENFVNGERNDLEVILKKMKAEKKLNTAFLSVIDVEKRGNTFLAIDALSKKLLTEILGVRFSKNIAQKDGIIMRKTIVPLLQAAMH